MTGPPIRVEGVREVKAALKELGRAEDRREFTRGYRRIAEEAASDIRAAIPVGPARGGHARDGVRPRSSQTGARVVIPRRTVPYYGWLDFGSRQPISGRPRSVGPWRGTGEGPGDGRYAYPTIGRNFRRYVDIADATMDDIIDNLKL